MEITSTSRNAIRGMELHLNRLHNPATQIIGLYSNYGNSRPIHYNSTLYRSPNKSDHQGCRKPFPARGLEASQSAHGNDIRHEPKILRRILGIPMQAARD